MGKKTRTKRMAWVTGVQAGKVVTPFLVPWDTASFQSMCLCAWDYLGIQVEPDSVQEYADPQGKHREFEVTDPHDQTTLLTITLR